MRKLIFMILFVQIGITSSYGQLFKKSQVFRIFGVDIKAKDVVGNRRFNDLGIKYFTSVINDFTDDTTSYLWRLGTVRLNTNDYTAGNIPLFNLSTLNHLGGYQLLDSIDFTYYRERGFQILESKDPSLLTNVSYKTFKDKMTNTSLSLKERRDYLWHDNNRLLREKLLSSRYFINYQPITLNRKLTTKVSAEVNSVIKTDIDNLLKIASNLKDTVTNQKVDTISLRAYFNRTYNRTIDLKGLYLSIVFQSDYTNRIKYIIEGINDNDAIVMDNNEFNNNLKLYIPGTTVALNSAMFAFKFSGGLDKKLVAVDSLKSDLATLFNIGAKQAASLATNANLMFSRHLEETYNNQFSKVWLIMFGTDDILDKLKFRNTQPVTNRNTVRTSKPKQQEAILTVSSN